MVVRELADNAGHAGLNRGSYLICQAKRRFSLTPSKAAFLKRSLVPVADRVKN